MPHVSRRTFLTAATATLASAALAKAATPQPPEAPELSQQPTPPAKKLNIAVVGLGKLAIEQILPAFANTEHCRIAGLVSGHPDKARTLAQRYHVADNALYTYENYDDIKSNPDIDAVYIVLPNSLHADFTIRAAKAGKHVLCEKPMCTSVDEAQKMIQACAENKRTLMIAYRIQYEPHALKAQQIIRSKTLGHTRIIVSENTQPQKGGTWRTIKALAGGGALPDIGLYCLNTSRFLLQEEPVELSAMTFSTPGDERFKEVEELMQFTVRFPSGAILSAVCSYGAADVKAYRVIADDGQIKADPAFPYKGLRLKTEMPGKQEGPKEETELLLPEADQFALEMDHFALAIQNKTPVKTPGEEGLKDQKIMAALYQSAATRKPIQL